MEFLIIWFLGSDIIDSGLRYNSAEECYAEAQNAGTDLTLLNIAPPQFTCVPIGKGVELKIYRNNTNSRFPF